MGIVAAYAVPHPPLIVPSVGRGEEKAIPATIDAYREVACRIARHEPETIILSSPHAPLYRDCFFIAGGASSYGDMSRFGVREIGIRAYHDTDFVAYAMQAARTRHIPLVSDDWYSKEIDHGTYVPLHFINECVRDYRLVRVGLSALPPRDHKALGQALAHVADVLDRRSVFVASGDLSHKLALDGPYGFAEEGPQFDRQIAHIFESGNLDSLFSFDEGFCDAAAECGLRSFQIMAGALDGMKVSSELLSYEGPFGVGYGVVALEPLEESHGLESR